MGGHAASDSLDDAYNLMPGHLAAVVIIGEDRTPAALAEREIAVADTTCLDLRKKRVQRNEMTGASKPLLVQPRTLENCDSPLALPQ